MAKKGTIFHTYSNEIKLSAVQSYLIGEGTLRYDSGEISVEKLYTT
ncbi:MULTISPECIES: hypothetical protein [Bacillus]|nr:hypothetical protein [Bacillus cereus]